MTKNSFVAAVTFIMFLDIFNLDKTRIRLHATFSKIELYCIYLFVGSLDMIGRII